LCASPGLARLALIRVARCAMALGCAASSRRRGRVPPTALGGPAQTRATASLRFRAMVGPDEVVEMEAAL
jgi:hypothetical protein